MTCTNLGGSQKEGVTFSTCFRKRGVPRKGRVPPEKGGGSNSGGNYELFSIPPFEIINVVIPDPKTLFGILVSAAANHNGVKTLVV